MMRRADNDECYRRQKGLTDDEAVRRRSSGARWRAGRFTMMAASVLLQADSRLAY
jgi:hypothetical protein